MLDLPTLSLVHGAVSLALATLLFVFARANRGAPGLDLAAAAQLVLGVATTLLAVRAALPEAWRVLLPNALVFVGLGTTWNAFRRFNRRPACMLPTAAASVAFTAAFASTIWIADDASLRAATGSTAYAIVSFLVVYELWRWSDRRIRRVSTAAAAMFAVQGALFLCRAAVALTHPAATEWSGGGLFLGAFMLSAIMLNILLVTCFVMMAAQRERVEAAAAARLHEEHLARAQRAAGIGTWEIDLATQNVTWSAETYRLFGVSPDAFSPRRDRILALVHPDDRAAARDDLDALLAGGAPASGLLAIDQRVALPDGSLRVLRREARTVLDAAGRPVGLIGTVQDVTARWHAEARLRASEERYQIAARAAGCAIWEWDVAADRVEWAGAIDEIFGYAADEIERSPDWWQARVHPEDGARIQAAREEAVAAGERYCSAEYRFRRADGSYAMVHDRAFASYDASGGLARMVGAMLDVTARKEIEQQLVQAQKMEALGTLAGGIAHDLNNTLVPILSLTRLVADSLPSESLDRADLEMVVDAACRARDLVRRVVAFGRKEAPNAEEIDLRAFLRTQLPILRAALPATIRIETALDPVPPVRADPAQLFQVVVNLVTNAAQAIGAGTGLVRIRLEARPRAVRLTIADTGCGMDQATAARIFEPFFTTKGPGEGTGLGLSVVHGIVGSHGGQVSVESAPGAGASFIVELPVALPAVPAGSGALAAWPAAEGSPQPAA